MIKRFVFVFMFVFFVFYVDTLYGKSILDVILTNNNYPELPKIKTEAEYTLTPAPKNPGDSDGRRLIDGEKPYDNWRRCVGWNYTDAQVIFDLKKVYFVDRVDLRLMGKACPKSIKVGVKKKDNEEFKEIAAKDIERKKGSFWVTIDFNNYVPARYVQIKLLLDKWGFYLREVRIWGKLAEDDISRIVEPAISVKDNALVIISGEQPNAAIVVADNASRKTLVAARFLQDFLRRMTNVVLPMITVSGSQGVKRNIYVGPELDKVGIIQQYPGNERFIVKKIDNSLILSGNDKGNYSGTKMAVCAFLEYLGARYYRYDKPKTYLIVPKLDVITIGKLMLDERPAFTRRSMWKPFDAGYQEYAKLWWDWNKLGGIILYTSHNDFVPKSEFAKHPEYFAMLKGKRTCEGEFQYCLTNRDLIKLVAQKAAKFFERNSKSFSYSLSPRDCGGFCQCPECKKIDAKFGRQMSNRVAMFANAVREELDRTFPQYRNRYLVFYAYWYTKQPPRKIILKKGVVPILVGDGCHMHFWNDPSCKKNVIIDSILSEWQTVSSERVAIYDWYIPGISDKRWEYFPWIAIRKPINDQQYWYTRHNVRWIQYETEHRMRYLPYRWITYYIAARGLWNPWQSPENILKDICSHLYGRASDVMFKVYMLLDDAMLQSKQHGFTWHFPSPEKIYSVECRAKIQSLLKQALELTKSNKDDFSRVNDAIDVWNSGWDRLKKLSEKETKVGKEYNPNLKKKAAPKKK